MSYIFEGKISNQSPKYVNYMRALCRCEKCGKFLELPDEVNININNSVFNALSYVNSKSFIYETKSGTAVTYCSKYCRNKHNHRFTNDKR